LRDNQAPPGGRVQEALRGVENADRAGPVLTVILWFWRGRTHHTSFDHTHVNAAAHMVSANLDMPHRVVCITGQPEGIRCETRDVRDISRKAAKKIGCDVGKVRDFRRLWLFTREAAEEFPDRVLNLDLDIVI